jgi:hypothetical protein
MNWRLCITLIIINLFYRLCRNLGVNKFSKFPTKGLRNLIEIKTHNNPELIDFPTSQEFPNVQNLVMSYAYHCCQFMPSTFEQFIPEYEGNLLMGIDNKTVRR